MLEGGEPVSKETERLVQIPVFKWHTEKGVLYINLEHGLKSQTGSSFALTFWWNIVNTGQNQLWVFTLTS